MNLINIFEIWTVLNFFFLGSEVLLYAVKVQDTVFQAEVVNEARQADFLFVLGAICLELIQCGLSTTPPLVNQGFELR